MNQSPHTDPEHQAINQFVSHVCTRINHHRAANLAWRVAMAGCIVMVFIGMFYVMQGYRVPMVCYGIVGLSALLVHVVIMGFIRITPMQAAHHADHYFDLKDTVASALGLANRKDDFCKLQAAQASVTVRKLNAQSIPYNWPRRTIASVACLLLLATLLGLKAESPQVRKDREQRQLITARTQEINDVLNELTKELLTVDENELKLDVDTKAALNDLKDQTQQMQAQQDLKIAMTQYAQLEQQVQKLMAKLDTKPAEKLLEKVGEQLKEDPNHRKLGQELANKQFKKAKESLVKHKQNHKLSKEQQKRALEQLKSLSASMARSAESASQANGASSSSSHNNDAKSNSMSKQISKSIAQLERDTNTLDDAQKKQSLSQQQNPQDQQACESACKSCNSSLSQLGQCMSKLSGQKKLSQQLAQMRQSLSQCQSFLSQNKKPSQCQSLGQCMNPGNKLGNQLKAGSAAAGIFDRMEQSMVQSGVLDQLNGLMGQGPSSKSTEQASEGSGTASDALRTVKRDYARELESFVQREDVPVPVRTGVKQYFENIHEMDHEVIRDSN